MSSSGHDYQPRKAGPPLYLLAVVLGCAAAWGLGGWLLGLAPLWLLLLAATLAAMLGCAMDEYIGEAIMLSTLIAVLTTLLYHYGPQAAFFRAGLVGAACGFCLGKLVIGVWKEL